MREGQSLREGARRPGLGVMPLVYRRALAVSRLEFYVAVRRACRDPRLALRIAFDSIDRAEGKPGLMVPEPSKHVTIFQLSDGSPVFTDSPQPPLNGEGTRQHPRISRSGANGLEGCEPLEVPFVADDK